MSEVPREIRQLAADLALYRGQEVTLVAYLKPRPGKEAETGDLLLSLVAPTREEPGCIHYHLHRSNGEPCVFMFYEHWRSQEDLDEHLAMPYLKTLFDKKDELLSEAIDVKIYTMTSSLPA